MDDFQGVFVAPEWDSDWLKLLLKINKNKVLFAAGSHVFELDNKEIGPVRWGVYFFFLQQKKDQISESMKRRIKREKEKL